MPCALWSDEGCAEALFIPSLTEDISVEVSLLYHQKLKFLSGYVQRAIINNYKKKAKYISFGFAHQIIAE